MRTALFGGSFDPVHLGHLFIAEAVCSQLDYERVLFVPTPGNPLKDEPRASAMHRYRMLALALRDNKKFLLSDIELQQSPPVFAVDTVKALYKGGLPQKAGFILGADALSEKEKWKRFDEFNSLIDIVVARRGPNLTHGYPEIRTAVPELSSCYVRSLLKKKASIRYLVPELVCHYIRRYGIYE